MCFPGGVVVKNLPANAGDARDIGSVPGLGTRVHLWWIHVDIWQNQHNIVK